MVTACDIRICSANASFSVKEVDVAITADMGTLQRLPRIVGDGRARELALTARSIAAEEALTCGLVSSIAHPTTEQVACPPPVLDASTTAATCPRQLHAYPNSDCSCNYLQPPRLRPPCHRIRTKRCLSISACDFSPPAAGLDTYMMGSR